MKAKRSIVHIDMDSFFASVEVLDDPSLAGKPLIVGADAKARGVVSTASYEARKLGVHSAMPMAQAVRLCPQGIVLPVRMERYGEISQQVFEVLQRFSTLVEPVSIDEAFIDVTESMRVWKTAEKIGAEIKKAVKETTGLTASVGIAPNKFLAKLGSDLKKPDGLVVITEENKERIIAPLKIERIWGVGKVTAKALHSAGIETIGQLRQFPVDQLQQIVGNAAEHLLQLSRGIDDRVVETFHEMKSMSSEHTFADDVGDEEILCNVLLEQVEKVAVRLRGHGLKARTITLKLRYGNFKTITRARTLPDATDITETIWKAALEIFKKWQKDSPGVLRLIGFGVSGFGEKAARQGLLFNNEAELQQEKHHQLDSTLDAIKEKYGGDSVKRKY